MKINRLFLLLFFFLTTNYSYSFNIKILWWNVHDFFDTTDDPEKDDKIYSNEEYNNKLFNISNQLKKIDADIIGLGEIENINVLKNLAINSGYQYYYLIEGNDTRGIDIALLSRYKLEAYISNRNRYTPYDENPKYKFSRDATVGIVKINDIRLYIITTHLKAGFQENNKNEKKKIAQEFGIINIIY